MMCDDWDQIREPQSVDVFTEEKIKGAIWGLGSDKPSRPDGFPMFFF